MMYIIIARVCEHDFDDTLIFLDQHEAGISTRSFGRELSLIVVRHKLTSRRYLLFGIATHGSWITRLGSRLSSFDRVGDAIAVRLDCLLQGRDAIL